MDNSMWRKDQFNKTDLQHKVEKINICAYPYQESPEYPSTNHWVMFLQTSASSSVKVEMYSELFGVVEVSSKDYTHPNQAVHIFSLNPTHEWTVQDFINLIITEKLYRYDFTEEGREGCRF
ncbi:hypothetical protein F5Y08DRAFT_340189 [Xylaria arbuscula]|nr:hypothetical protein F5Y08DRAFT_340189 [Xylaria arbuscula]